MYKIKTFKNAKFIFKYLVRKRDTVNSKYKNLAKNSYLLISNVFDRNIFLNDKCKIDTLYLLGRYGKNIDKQLFISLSDEQKFVYSFGKYLKKPSFSNLILLIKEQFKFLSNGVINTILRITLSLVDLFLVLVLSFLSILNSILNNNSFHKNQIEEIYSIYYWQRKRSDSITYYYPDFMEKKQRLAYISMFFGYRFIFKGLLDSFLEKRILTALDFIDFKIISNSLISLLKIYLFDFFNKDQLTFGRLITNFNSLGILSRRFYALLNYYSSSKLISVIKPSKVYLWSENHPFTNALSIGLAKYIKTNKITNTSIYTFIGYQYYLDHFPHLTPSIFELNNNIWGLNNFMFTDPLAEKEMKKSLLFYPNIKYFLSRKSLKRYLDDSHIINSLVITRDLTFFANGDRKDFLILIFRFFSNTNILSRFSPLDKYTFYIRLHPMLDKKNIIRDISLLAKKYCIEIPEFNFIINEYESLETSLSSTRFCIFSNSTILNMAVKYSKNILIFRTSFLYEPAISKDNLIKYKLKVF